MAALRHGCVAPDGVICGTTPHAVPPPGLSGTLRHGDQRCKMSCFSRPLSAMPLRARLQTSPSLGTATLCSPQAGSLQVKAIILASLCVSVHRKQFLIKSLIKYFSI